MEGRIPCHRGGIARVVKVRHAFVAVNLPLVNHVQLIAEVVPYWGWQANVRVACLKGSLDRVARIQQGI